MLQVTAAISSNAELSATLLCSPTPFQRRDARFTAGHVAPEAFVGGLSQRSVRDIIHFDIPPQARY